MDSHFISNNFEMITVINSMKYGTGVYVYTCATITVHFHSSNYYDFLKVIIKSILYVCAVILYTIASSINHIKKGLSEVCGPFSLNHNK